MLHIKVSCQKRFALTRMNSECTSPSPLNLPSLFSARGDLSSEALSRLPLSLSLPGALSGSLQLSSPSSFPPSVSPHISLGLVPLIKHSCRAHRKAPLFFFFSPHCYINWPAVSLGPRPRWFLVTSVTVVVYVHRARSSIRLAPFGCGRSTNGANVSLSTQPVVHAR